MIANLLLCACIFVCPLVFLTDLTRNPYFTQITLLNVFLLLIPAVQALRFARKDEWVWPRSPLDAPWLAWLGVCLLSWGLSYAGHAPFFRPSIFHEGVRVMLFTLVNTYLAYLAGAWLTEPGSEETPLGPFIVLAAGFGAAWLLFPSLKSPAANSLSVWDRLWDPYGALVWAGGAGAALWLGRRAALPRLFHLMLAVGLLAAAYGVLQYFNIEVVWSKVLNPYGGRAVSTFGNPNFLSTFTVLLMPGVFMLFLRSEGRRRWFYGLAFLLLTSALLASLTRSSWGGALAAALALFAWPEARALLKARRREALVVAGLALALAAFWPRSPVQGYQATALERLTEAVHQTEGGGVYAPWHQRLLMWSVAWQLGLESPVFGKGWGLLEMFYPFYQGPLMLSVPLFRNLRTHSNNAHNEILEVFSQTGLLGLGVWIWFWLVFFRMARSSWERRDGGWVWPLAAGAAGVLVDNLLNVSMHFATPAFALYWIVGALAGRQNRLQRRSWRPGPALGWALACAVCAASAAGCWFWLGQWEREVHYLAGFKMTRQGPQALETARRQLRLAYDWNGWEVNNNYELGNALAREGRSEDAVWAYRQAIDANAGYDEIYYNLGTILGVKLDRWKEAEDYYKTAVEINPFSHDAVGALIAYELREPQKNAPLARRLIADATTAFPDEPAFLNNLGYLESMNGRLGEAAAAYEEALSLDPGFQLAERNLRATLQSTRGGSKALAALSDLQELERRVQAQRVDPDTLKLAQRVASVFGRNPRSRYYLGTLKLALGDPSGALEDLRFVAAHAPPSDKAAAPARVNLGLALEKLGLRAEAQEQFRAALQLDPSNAIARRRLSGQQ